MMLEPHNIPVRMAFCVHFKGEETEAHAVGGIKGGHEVLVLTS